MDLPVYGTIGFDIFFDASPYQFSREFLPAAFPFLATCRSAGSRTTSQLLGAAQGPRMTFTDKSPILRFPALVMIQNVNLPAVLSESTGTRTMVSTLNYLLAREAAVT